MEVLFNDDVPFVLTTNAPPFKTLPVDMDGNCFFRYTITISCVLKKIGIVFNLLHSSLVPRAISLAISGTPENHHKLRILCLSKMKAVWDTQVGKGFPFSDLACRRYVGAGGRLDRHGAVPYEPYIALLGKFPLIFF